MSKRYNFFIKVEAAYFIWDTLYFIWPNQIKIRNRAEVYREVWQTPVEESKKVIISYETLKAFYISLSSRVVIYPSLAEKILKDTWRPIAQNFDSKGYMMYSYS